MEAGADIRILRATIEQQAAWLREITTERDALKLRMTELEEERDILQRRWHSCVAGRQALREKYEALKDEEEP